MYVAYLNYLDQLLPVPQKKKRKHPSSICAFVYCVNVYLYHLSKANDFILAKSASPSLDS